MISMMIMMMVMIRMVPDHVFVSQGEDDYHDYNSDPDPTRDTFVAPILGTATCIKQ